MSIALNKGSIILTDDAAKNFSRKMNHPNHSTMIKRDKFIEESRERIGVTHSRGKVTLTIK